MSLVSKANPSIPPKIVWQRLAKSSRLPGRETTSSIPTMATTFSGWTSKMKAHPIWVSFLPQILGAKTMMKRMMKRMTKP